MGHRAAVFPDVADTPTFREKVADIESGADITRESCSKLAKEASKYCEGLDTMAGMHEAFAAALQSFCPSTKQDTDVFGRAKFERFGQMLCSMAEFTRNLHREIIHNMVEPLNSVWVGQLCTDVPREKHSCESSQKAYDGLKHRYLGLKKLTRKEVVKRTEDDLRKAKAKADLARYNMVKKLTEMELMKSYDFLLMLSTCMEAHMTYFQEGRELFESSKEDLISAKDLVYCRRVEMQSEMERLDYLISCEKEKVQLQEEINDGLETAPTGTVNCGGPLQMSAANQKIAEIEAHVQVALRSRGQQRKTLKRGYLLKRSSNMRGAWKERFFKLDSRGLLFYQSKKKNGDPKWYLRLLTASVKDNDDEDLRFCFTVVSPNKALTLQAENEAEKQEWIQVIQTVIHCLLHSSEDPNLFYDDLYVRNHSRGQTHSFSHDDFHLAPSDYSFSHSYTPDPRSASFRGFRGSLITQPTSASYIRASRSLDYFSRPPPVDVSDSSDTPFDRVGKSNGNHVCADCGAPDPEWASLNLGVVVCIECSGVHRQLGVQISKMRSLKLDVKVWTEPLLRVFSCLGNETCNKIWEYELQRHEMQLRLNEEWEDTEEEGELYPSSSQIDSSEDFLTDSDGRELEMPMADFKKPTPTSPLNEKEAFIRLKYVERRFLAKAKPRTKIDTMLWNSIFREDIKGAYTALIGGADINSMHATNAAKALVGQLHGKIYGAEEVLSPRFTHYAPVLLLACRSGNLAVLEFMLQNNANLDLVDSCRRGTLHYSVGFNRKEAIKMLLEKGAKKDAPDLNGLTPVDVANKLSLEEGTIELLMPHAD